MDTINIGILLPSSTIFSVGKDYEKGLKDGLKPLKDKGLEVELIKEFIGSGETKAIENACNKFFNYDDVDIVTGILSNRSVVNVAERFKGQKIPLLVSNPGGQIPNANQLNEYQFFNSMHLWRHAYTLGNWGVKAFGKKGMYIGSVYDAGYSFSHMMHVGMMAASPEAYWSFSVPGMPPPGSLSDMSVIFPFLEEYQPDFILATFCGAETTLFLNEFIARGWHHKTKVLGLPYLLAPFEPLNDDITIYTTIPFEAETGIAPAKAFYQLGLQAGQNITDAAKAAQNQGQLHHELAKLNRMFTVDNANPYKAMADELTIMQNSIKANDTGFTSVKFAQAPTLNLDADLLKPLTTAISTGWYNPYLCI